MAPLVGLYKPLDETCSGLRTGVHREDDRERLGRPARRRIVQGFVDDVVDPRHHGEEQDEVVAVGVELHRLVELRVGKRR